MKKVIDDVNNRGKLAGVIIEDRDGLLQLVSYDDNGVVSFISDKVKGMTLNERIQGNVVRPIAEILRREK